MAWTDADFAHMRQALALARSGLGQTGVNPCVGCVIVRAGQVIGTGRTQAGGRPHGEAMALDQVGGPVEGATLYVTLEPCAHISPRGPSCADALVSAMPARVVIATIDPDPRTAGQGIARLQAAGLKVDLGLLETEARHVMRGFFHRVATGSALMEIGDDDACFDDMLPDAPPRDLVQALADLGARGMMLVGARPGSATAKLALKLGLIRAHLDQPASTCSAQGSDNAAPSRP